MQLWPRSPTTSSAVVGAARSTKPAIQGVELLAGSAGTRLGPECAVCLALPACAPMSGGGTATGPQPPLQLVSHPVQQRQPCNIMVCALLVRAGPALCCSHQSSPFLGSVLGTVQAPSHR
jgi:hypothetical protein